MFSTPHILAIFSAVVIYNYILCSNYIINKTSISLYFNSVAGLDSKKSPIIFTA